MNLHYEARGPDIFWFQGLLNRSVQCLGDATPTDLHASLLPAQVAIGVIN